MAADRKSRSKNKSENKNSYLYSNFNSASHMETLVLAGNPNVGKSVFFNALTSSYADVSNFPGTTVDITSGYFDDFKVMDTPGVYGLSSLNDEEIVAEKAVRQADLILNIIDGTRLERDLYLTQQLIDTGKPVIAVLNMMDEVEKQGIRIDIKQLEQELGIPVYPAAGGKKIGISAVREAILNKTGRVGNFVCSDKGRQDDLIGGGSATGVGHANPAADEGCTSLRRSRADQLGSRVIRSRTAKKKTASDRLGAASVNPFLGIPMLLIFLIGVYLFIGKFLTQTVVGFTEGTLMGTWYYNLVTRLLLPIIDTDSFLGTMLIGEYGILTMVPIYLFGLLLPLVVGFYLLMSLLEDSGLLPRIAVLCDRTFTSFGLNGKAIIPMLLGFGCVTMALITTRILGSKRERLIASALLCLAVPCSAQFAVIMAVAGTLEAKYLAVYGIIILAVFIIIGWGLNQILPGSSTSLFLTLPPLRMPSPGNVLKKTAVKSKHFIKDAGPMFLLGGALISFLNYCGGFVFLRKLLAPVTTGLLSLPEETASLFFISMIKRDLGATAMYSMVEKGLLTQPQIAVVLTVMTLFVPCTASLMVLAKERGPLAAVLIWFGSFIAAFTAGAAAAWML